MCRKRRCRPRVHCRKTPCRRRTRAAYMTRKAAKDKRLIRLLRLLRMLQSGSGKNVAALAKACRVGPRTIYRDLQALRSVDVPIEFDWKVERYFLAGQLAMPPTEFTSDEALKLVALTAEFGRE